MTRAQLPAGAPERPERTNEDGDEVAHEAQSQNISTRAYVFGKILDNILGLTLLGAGLIALVVIFGIDIPTIVIPRIWKLIIAVCVAASAFTGFLYLVAYLFGVLERFDPTPGARIWSTNVPKGWKKNVIKVGQDVDVLMEKGKSVRNVDGDFLAKDYDIDNDDGTPVVRLESTHIGEMTPAEAENFENAIDEYQKKQDVVENKYRAFLLRIPRILSEMETRLSEKAGAESTASTTDAIDVYDAVITSEIEAFDNETHGIQTEEFQSELEREFEKYFGEPDGADDSDGVVGSDAEAEMQEYINNNSGGEER